MTNRCFSSHTVRRAARFVAWAGLAGTVDRLARLRTGRRACLGTLVVRLDDIGDYVLWREAASVLRHILPPGLRPLTLLAEQSWARLAEDSGCFDVVWPVSYSRLVTRPSYRYEVLRRVSRAGFAAAINPMHSRGLTGRGGPLWGDAVVRASGAPVRLSPGGVSAGPGGLPGRVTDRWYTGLIPTPPGAVHESRRHGAFLSGLADALGSALPETAPPPQAFTQSGTEQTTALLPRGDFYVLFPGSRMSFKCWPASRFAEIARRLYGLTGWSGVVCGGPGEAELGAALAGEQPPVTDLVGKTSLAGLVEVIRRARLVVTNDTVAVHFAGAVEIPSVCVLGGGHYGRFLPYPGGGPLAVTHRMDCFGCDWECVHRTPPGRPYPCVDRVTVDDVWEAVLELVGTGAAAGTAEAGSGRSLALAQTLPASKENFR